MKSCELSLYESFGWVVIRDIVTPSLRASAVKWLYEAAARASDDSSLEPEFEPETVDGRSVVRKLRRLLWNDTPFWKDWLDQSRIFQLGRTFITGEPAIVFHAAFLKPGVVGTEVALHQDQALWTYDYPEAVSVWIALSDSTEHNGCIKLCSGSHLRGLIPHRSDEKYSWHPSLDSDLDSLPTPQKVPMAQGDVLVWHRYLVHGSDPNMASEDRIGMVVVFADSAASNFKAKDVMRVSNVQSSW